MVKKGYGALIIGANSSCSNLNFFKKGDYPYIHIIHTTIRLASSLRWGCFSAP